MVFIRIIASFWFKSEFYGYDYAGNLIKSTDGAGNTTTYEYNGINQLSRMMDPEGYEETYCYDTEERLCKKIDRNGIITKYAYNLYGSLLERRAKKPEDEIEQWESYEYTKEGLLQAAITPRMRYGYVYDAMDRLVEKQASGRTLLSFVYDLDGNVMQQTDVTGKHTTYHYDLSNRLTEVWDNGKCIAKYEYYLDDTIKSLNCGSLYTTYGYDADQNVTSLKTVLGEEVCIENHYSYDGNGNRVEKRQLQGTTTYTYDSRNRLVKAEYPDRMEQLFYDPAGNRSKRITETTEEIYQYDKRNRLTTYTKDGKTTQLIYDPAGNLLKDSNAIYEYDAFHRNTKVETYNGNIQINRYDAEGLRHEIEENGTLVSFLFRGREVVVEETKEEQIRYIRTNELLASDAESARTYYHYASDEMGSITHVVEDTTILNRYEYDAWGNTTTWEETVNNRFRFNGQQYDPVSQQYYLRARYYNPVIGRFTQEDIYQEDGLNLYVYCRNNPVYYVDPSGNTCETDAKSITNKIKHVSKNERKKLVAHNQNKGGTDTVTYRRVQGGAGNQSSQQRVVIDSEGNVYINKKDRNLNISIDNGEHSQYYINNNRPGADIYEFEVPKWLDDMVKEYTIPQAGYKNNPLNQGGSAPKLTDPTTPGTCIEFPAPWIEWIEEYATNGRIISGGQ